MKIPVPDSLFVRLFLLLFFILSISHFAGREIFISLGSEHSASAIHPQHHPFRMVNFLIRLAAVALTAWVAARWLSNPIKRMAQAADELGKNLNSPPVSETSGPSEIRQASKVFNQMQMRLKQQMEERNRFLAAVSHDLRTPLTRLKLRAEKIDAQDLQKNIQSDINEMTAMIDATLDYLRGDGRPEEICFLDVSALVHSLAENAGERGEVVTVSGTAKPIMAQPVALLRCLNNLIENALRYGNRADIKLDDSGDKLIISIRDAGAGVPEDQLEAVFAPFYRLDQSRSRHTGGVGLGLSIARDIARKQGGDITLKNAPEGGLIATLVLPKRC